jgi:hypothetical protein
MLSDGLRIQKMYDKRMAAITRSLEIDGGDPDLFSRSNLHRRGDRKQRKGPQDHFRLGVPALFL